MSEAIFLRESCEKTAGFPVTESGQQCVIENKIFMKKA